MDLSFLQGLISDHAYATITAVVAAVCGCAAWICTLLPAPTEQSGWPYKALYKMLNFLGANKGKATNADDADSAAKRLP